MAYEYLSGLGLSEAPALIVRSLGARTPSALLSMVEHSWEKFVRFLGEEQTEHLHQALLRVVPPEEREKLKSLPQFTPKLGALPVPAKKSPVSIAAQQERDRLMQDIQRLRESKDESLEKQQLLEALESRLRNLLKFTVAAH